MNILNKVSGIHRGIIFTAYLYETSFSMNENFRFCIQSFGNFSQNFQTNQNKHFGQKLLIILKVLSWFKKQISLQKAFRYYEWFLSVPKLLI